MTPASASLIVLSILHICQLRRTTAVVGAFLSKRDLELAQLTSTLRHLGQSCLRDRCEGQISVAQYIPKLNHVRERSDWSSQRKWREIRRCGSNTTEVAI